MRSASIKSPYALAGQAKVQIFANFFICLLSAMPNTLRKQHVQPFLLLDQEQKDSEESAETAAEPTKCSFRLVKKIGQGGYGSVYLVQKNQGSDSEAFYAMKVCITLCVVSIP